MSPAASPGAVFKATDVAQMSGLPAGEQDTPEYAQPSWRRLGEGSAYPK